MAVSNPPIRASQIIAEFGGPTPGRLSEYRRGVRVPNSPPNAGVPTALPLRLSTLAGAVNYTPPVVNNSPAPVNVVNLVEPPTRAPTRVMSAGTTASATGGTGGPYTYSWAYLSGDSGLTPTAATNVATLELIGTVPKNSSRTAVWRVTVSDGTGSATRDITFDLVYNTTI